MEPKNINQDLKNIILGFQKNEITEYYVYKKIAKFAKGQKNQEVLSHIGDDEHRHHDVWQYYTNQPVKPKKSVLFFYPILAKILGITFAVKLMEKGEEFAQLNYQKVLDKLPETKAIFDDENKHEHQLIEIIQEEKLTYLGSIVLGLNDALVELTGALAGLSFALQNTRLIALAGLITGIAASLSMAGSQYLSKSTDRDPKAVRASVYTGIAYIVTVLLLTAPYLFLKDYRMALACTLIIGILIIFSFTYFSATVQNDSFKRKFFQMTVISLGVALISFLIGAALRTFLGVNV